MAFELELLTTSVGTPDHRSGTEALQVDAKGARALTQRPGATIEDVPSAWDLVAGKPIAGAWLRLLDDGVHGIRRETDGAIVVAEIASGRTAYALEGLRWPLAPPKPSPDGAFAVSSLGADRKASDRPSPFVEVWSLSTGRRLHRIAQPMLLGMLVAGERMLSLDEKHSLSVWDLRTGKRVSTCRGPRERPALLRVSPSGARAVTVGVKGLVTVWDLEKPAVVATHEAFTRLRGGPGKHVRLMADGRRLLSEGWFLDVLDLESGALDRSWVTRDPNGDPIHAVEPMAEGPLVAVLMGRGLFGPNMAEIWDVDTKLLVASAEVLAGLAMAVHASRVVVASEDEVTTFRLHANPEAKAPAQPEVPDAIRKAHAKATVAKARRPAVAKKAPKKKAKARRKR
jgi:hypothetical protein